MALTCGIVGLPNVGKSSLFNTLTAAQVPAANYPFCTIAPHTGIAQVPDARLEELRALVQPTTCIPAVVQLVDIAGLVRGASQGEGLGNQFLGHILSVQVVVHVIRCFEDPAITHVHNTIDPLYDQSVVETELQIKDLERVDNHISRTQSKHKATPTTAKPLLEVLHALRTHLNQGHPARTFAMDDHKQKLLADLPLLTRKPIIYVANVAEQNLAQGNAHTQALQTLATQQQAAFLIMSIPFEQQLSQLNPQDQQDYLSSYGLQAPATHSLVRLVYAHLGLITFFTAGSKEVRAWTIRQNTPAVAAAGVIHSDFEKNFIRAEVISHADFLALGSVAACRKAGKLAVQGKEYIVQDGDILHFLTS